MSSTNLYPDFETKWKALSARDERAAKCFLYCVKSTGIYCRPTCAARLARKKNVIFYDTVSEAEAAGFRPCKRCKPMLPLHESHHSVIRATCRLLDNSPKSAPGLKVLADNVGFTQWHFHRVFRRFTGMTPRMYWEARHGKMAGKFEDIIGKIADLNENTVIDYDLIKRSYSKNSIVTQSTKNKKPFKKPNIMPLSPKPSDTENEPLLEKELPFSPDDFFFSTAETTPSDAVEPFDTVPTDDFFDYNMSPLSPAESLESYFNSFPSDESQPDFDTSSLHTQHDISSNLINDIPLILAGSSTAGCQHDASSDLGLFDLETSLGDMEVFNLLDKSLNSYIFSQ